MHSGFIAPRHVESSQTRVQTRVPHVGRRILTHFTTRDAGFVLCFEVKFTEHESNHFRVNNSVAFSGFTMFCSHCLSSSQTSLSPQKETLCPLAVTPHASPPLSPREAPVCFLCLWLSLFWMFHMSGNCPIGGLLCLASFTSHNVFKFPPYGISASFLL